MALNPSALSVNLVVSRLGAGCFVYGRKKMDLPFIAAGLMMMGYSFFANSVLSTALVGLAANSGS